MVNEQDDFNKLFDILTKRFNEEELKTLIFYMGSDNEYELVGENWHAKVM